MLLRRQRKYCNPVCRRKRNNWNTNMGVGRRLACSICGVKILKMIGTWPASETRCGWCGRAYQAGRASADSYCPYPDASNDAKAWLLGRTDRLNARR